MLKSRLEIAHFKVGRSWQNLPFKSVEPQLEREAKLRNPDAYTANESATPTSPGRDTEFLVPNLPTRSRASDHIPPRQSMTADAPAAVNGGADHARPRISPLKRRRSSSSERDSPGPATSPLRDKASASGSFRERLDPRSLLGNVTTPPSTPPPSHTRRDDTRSLRSGKEDAEEGADLLLYLATSPSPAKSRRLNHASDFSSPPPIRGSSAVNTPVGAGFNLSDFLNFSPSPAVQITRAPRLDVDKFSPAKLTYEAEPILPSSRLG